MRDSTSSAVERLRQNTFELRDVTRRPPSMHVGTLIKVGVRGERFWCQIDRIRRDGSLVAIVDNDLLKSPWKCGDEVVVQRKHVIETADPNDLTFASLLAAHGSFTDACMAWKALRIAGGSGVKPKPETCFVFPR